MKKNQKLILVFAMVALFLTIMVGNVSALDVEIIGNEEQQSNNEAVTNDTNETAGNNTAGTINTTTNTTNTTNIVGNNTTLPQTGIEDNTLLLVAFIGIFAVSAIYAYRKIRDYKNI